MLARLTALAAAASLWSPSLGLDIPQDVPVSQLLASAHQHLSQGETNHALAYYDAAIARDPNNCLTFFKRATTHLSLGRSSQATHDFESALALNPDFERAHVQLGKIKERVADWDGARRHYNLAGKPSSSPETAQLEAAERAALLAESAVKNKDWEECVSQANVAIATASRAVSLREIRALCRLERGDLAEGISDLAQVQRLKPGDTTPYLKMSAINFYAMNDLPNGLAAVRKCLQSDPDSKVCKRLLNDQKLAEKSVRNVKNSLERGQHTTAVRQLVPTGENPGLIKQVRDNFDALQRDGTIPVTAKSALVTHLVEMACQAYYESSSKKAKEWCEESLKLNEDSFYGLLHRAKGQLDSEDFEASINTLKKAREADPEKEDLVESLMHKAHVALKRSKTKDYYKVLGVAHDADDRQIKSAYRKASKRYHPDKAAKLGLSKEEAEKKMASINEAYEVLADSELRARFDAGVDPNSHEQHNPFHGAPFGSQFAGGDFQYPFRAGGSPGGFQFHFGG